MPKSNIYGRTEPGVNVETGEPVPVQPRRISIGWSRGQHAQLGIGWVDRSNLGNVPPSTTFSADFMIEGELDEQGRHWRSQWIDVDRHMVNQLIRELRKARDEAFGRDE